jgi:glycosyltransferase involved in cell wall biosynthesis
MYQRFDVLEADHMPYLQIPVLRLIATLRRKRLVVTWHEVWGRRYWRDYLGMAGRIAWLMESLAMRLPDHIIAASPQTADRLRSILGAGAQITVAPNGIDLSAIRASRPGTVPVDLVTVGRLISHKRVDMLLDAVALLHAEGIAVTCRIIGNGPERDALAAQARRRGIIDAVEFRQDVASQDELYSLLKAARVFVSPSAREGFGIATLEAIACGLLVVTTSAPDNLAQHLVARSDQGSICDPTARALADTLKGLVASTAGDLAGTSEPEPWLEEFSWDVTASHVATALALWEG